MDINYYHLKYYISRSNLILFHKDNIEHHYKHLFKL